MKFRITLKSNKGNILDQETTKNLGRAAGWFNQFWRHGRKDFKKHPEAWGGEGFVITEYFDNAGAGIWHIDGEYRFSERKPHYSQVFKYSKHL